MDALLQRVIDALNSTALSEFVMTNAYFFPILEMAHFIGLCLLFGSLIIVDLRIIGLGRSVPMERVDRYVIFALSGFAINLISGIFFVIGDSDRYLVNIAFQMKMLLIVIAGLNTAYFMRRVKPQMVPGATSSGLTKDARIVASLSLLLWTSVIILGRFIPYVEDL
jgi:hypothetical protein